MDIENILSIFSRLSGTDEDFSVNFRFMCEYAKDYISAHILHDADTSRSGGKLDFAAAALAYYRFILWSAAENGDDISVGDVSVKSSSSSRIDHAWRVCQQAFDDIADVFDNGYFVFEGI